MQLLMRKLFQYCHFLYYFCISSFKSRLVLVSFKSNILLILNSMPSIRAPSFIFVISDYFKRTANILLHCMPILSLFVFVNKHLQRLCPCRNVVFWTCFKMLLLMLCFYFSGQWSFRSGRNDSFNCKADGESSNTWHLKSKLCFSLQGNSVVFFFLLNLSMH